MIDQWCRRVMNEEVEKKVRTMPYKKMSALEISGAEWKDFGFKSYENVQFPDFDICKQTKNKLYDIIIAEQVFEHIEDPWSAAENIFKMLKKDGVLVITTPFLIKFHPAPLDMWRWSKEGLRVFLEKYGFKDVETFSWGNKICVVENLENWPAYEEGHHSLKNEEDYPIVVWGFAYRRKINSRSLLTR